MTRLLAFFLLFILSGNINAQPRSVQWVKMSDLENCNKTAPKKVMVDVYTDWCGWCKKMDKNTFSDPVITEILSKKFHAVKFNAESPDDLVFKGKTFKNNNPGKSRSIHELANYLMNNQASFPTLVFLDENLNPITPVPGYMEPKDLEPVLEFIAGDHYKTQKWEDFKKNFKGQCK